VCVRIKSGGEVLSSKIRNIVVVFLFAAIISGCAAFIPRVISTVTTFSTSVMAIPEGRTLFVSTSSTEQENNLEFEFYKEKLETKYSSKGFRIVQDPSSAQMIVFMSYGIDDGKNISAAYSIPQWGKLSGGTTYTQGNVGGYSYTSSSYSMPEYGVTGYVSGTSNRTQYARAIAIDVVDAGSFVGGSPKKLQEIRIKSTGSCAVIAGVFDAMLEAGFRDYPGENGKTKTIITPWEAGC
jgi:hypothetical protein